MKAVLGDLTIALDNALEGGGFLVRTDGEARRIAEIAISAIEAEGYFIVPAIPTEAMVEAGIAGQIASDSDHDAIVVRAGYAAMLSARPRIGESMHPPSDDEPSMSRMDIAHKLFMDGATSDAAAKTAGVSASQFIQWRVKAGYTNKKAQKLRADVAEVCAAWSEFILESSGIDVRETTRRREVAWMRQSLFCALYRDGHSLLNIAAIFGMDHTTVLHAVRQVEQCPTRNRWALAIAQQNPVDLARKPVSVREAAAERAAARNAERAARNAERVAIKARMVADVLRRHRAGETLAEIAISYRKTLQWASLILRQAGYKIIPHNHYVMPPDKEAVVRALYDAGCADAEIVRQTGISKDAVRKWRGRNKLKAHYAAVPNAQIPNPKADEVIALRGRGLSYGKIARQLGITRNVVAGICCRNGV